MAAPRYWSVEQDAELMRQRADGVDYADIGKHFDCTKGAIASRVRLIKKLEALKAEGVPAKRRPRAYTAEDIATLLRMREVECKQFDEIGRVLKRSPQNCCDKYRSLRPNLYRKRKRVLRAKQVTAISIVVPMVVAPAHASITSAFFGDPLPGRSALDQRLSRLTPAAGAHHDTARH